MVRVLRARELRDRGELLAQEPRRLLEHVVDQRLERGCADLLLPRDRLADLTLELERERLPLTGDEPAACQQVGLEAADRIALPFPHLGHALVAIARGIIRGRVRADPVGQELEERRAVTAPRLVGGVADRVVDGEHVVPVDPQRLDAIAHALERDRLGGGLQRARRGDRPLVVLADQHARCLADACEVERHVEVTLARAAVAHVAEAHGAFALDLHRHRDPDRVRDLRRDARAHHDVVMLAIARMTRHLPALRRIRGVAEDLRDVAVEREPAVQADPRLAQRGDDPVLGTADRGGADDRGLLAHGLAVEPDPALALERHHPRIGHADPHHRLEQPAGECAIEARERGLVDRGAVLADQLEQAACLRDLIAIEVRERAGPGRGDSLDHAPDSIARGARVYWQVAPFDISVTGTWCQVWTGAVVS